MAIPATNRPQHNLNTLVQKPPFYYMEQDNNYKEQQKTLVGQTNRESHSEDWRATKMYVNFLLVYLWNLK